jgi:hypothetical protein
MVDNWISLKALQAFQGQFQEFKTIGNIFELFWRISLVVLISSFQGINAAENLDSKRSNANTGRSHFNV